MLFLGSFLKIIVKCKANNTSQKEIVGSFMKSLDPKFEDSENNGISTNLAGGLKNPSDYVMEKISQLGAKEYEGLTVYFDEHVVGLIKENEQRTVFKAICLLIKEDEAIKSDTIVDLISGKKKNELDYSTCDDYAVFLASIFLFVLKNTDNRQKRGLADAQADEYIKKAKELPENMNSFGDSMQMMNSQKNANESFRCFCDNYFSCAGVASILGKWDENNKYDIEFIEGLTGEKYTDYRELIRVENHMTIDLEERINVLRDVSQFRRQMIEEIDESHLKIFLDSLESILFKSSLYLGISNVCMDGIVDFLALLRANSKMRKRLDNNELHNCLYFFEKDVLGGKSEHAIRCLLRSSCTLLEADIRAFLWAIEEQIKTKDSKLIELVRGDNHEVVYPLADALRKSAMSDRFFPDAMMLFDKLSEINKLFERYMKIIIIPEYIQTTAGIDAQMGIIKKLYRLKPDWTWNYVSDLMPGNSPDSYRRLKYRYLPIHVDDLSEEEYKIRISTFSSFLCDKTNRCKDQMIKLLSMIPFIDNDVTSAIVDVITKESAGEEAEVLWGVLQRVTKYVSADDEEKQKMLDILRSHFLSGKEKFIKKELFSYRNVLKKSDEIVPVAKECIQDLYKSDGLGGIATFAMTVENTFLLADITVQIIPKEQQIELINILSDEKYNRFRALLVGKLSSEELIEYIKRDTSKQIYLVSDHMIDNKLVTYGIKLKTPEQDLFWKNVSVSGCDSLNQKNYVKLIKQLQKYNRYDDAIRALAYCLDKKENDADLIFDALNGYDILEEVNSRRTIEYEINELIGYLQDKATDRTDEIAEIEKKYIHELVPLGITSPKYVLYKMANEPEYVEKLIKAERERYKDGYFSTVVDTLFYHCKIAPGTQADGTFDYTIFMEWINYVDTLQDSPIKDKMLSLFAKMIIYTPPDLDGFIMNRNVADYIENSNNGVLQVNIETALFNSVGSIDVTPGSDAKYKVVNQFRESAVSFMNEGYYEIGRIYRNVADIFENHYIEENE